MIKHSCTDIYSLGGGGRFWTLFYGKACAKTRPLSAELSTDDPYTGTNHLQEQMLGSYSCSG